MDQSQPMVVRGAAAGLAAAAAAALAWYLAVVVTGYQLGIVAVLVGWLVGRAVLAGAGDRGSRTLQGLSVAITLLTMVVSEYLIVRHWINLELGPVLPALLPVDLMVGLVRVSIEEDPVTLLFWAIALWQAYRVTAEPQPQPGSGAPVAPEFQGGRGESEVEESVPAGEQREV